MPVQLRCTDYGLDKANELEGNFAKCTKRVRFSSFLYTPWRR